jgi:phosphoribosylformimino-5-aminoimidazole carboxamide ribonucleotide (ProFAR) isomerase
VGGGTIFYAVFFVDEAFVGELCQEWGDKVAFAVDYDEVFDGVGLAYAVEGCAAVDHGFLAETEEHVC